MTQAFALHGIAGGAGNPDGFAEFFVYESNICSTSHLPDIERMNLKGQWDKIRVPCLNVEEHWRKHFGGTRCHILKVDIEGSELDFFRTEQSFLTLVDSILVEWHAWRVTLDDLRKFLEPLGFAYVKTVEESEQMGTAFFRRK
jgi:FkbM family methyltransferase